ncbi:hypothetical protein JRO89_XS15G0007300 [Xanthoceras sorbifolium]|uniref:Uncharacterized protein n=1 Tax=Xanthoceras sorbifolium TaxID=99658 RepID=A0ABQ8H0J8_9ROSI|nr:hypothetical protein JRO89_XS15G0007300 [Xanthoceras sorbifolium]
MTSLKKLIRMAKKWQKLAGRNQKRVLFPRNNGDVDAEIDHTWFVIPLKYLENSIIRKLFIMAEAEFGLPSSGHITLPCDAVFMKLLGSTKFSLDLWLDLFGSMPSCTPREKTHKSMEFDNRLATETPWTS